MPPPAPSAHDFSPQLWRRALGDPHGEGILLLTGYNKTSSSSSCPSVFNNNCNPRALRETVPRVPKSHQSRGRVRGAQLGTSKGRAEEEKAEGEEEEGSRLALLRRRSLESLVLLRHATEASKVQVGQSLCWHSRTSCACIGHTHMR